MSTCSRAAYGADEGARCRPIRQRIQRMASYVADRDGFRNWFPAHLHTTGRPAANSPVGAQRGRSPSPFLTRCPPLNSISPSTPRFARRRSPTGYLRLKAERHCALRGVDPASLAARRPIVGATHAPQPRGRARRFSYALRRRPACHVRRTGRAQTPRPDRLTLNRAAAR